MKEHPFTTTIRQVLSDHFAEYTPDIFAKSALLQYINEKTVSATRGSKARGSFGNLYAIYVLVEDYLARGFDESETYRTAAGAKFTDLLQRQRELPFGSKLQNHALNHRLNEEFGRYFPTLDAVPIIRDKETNEYWINENLLFITMDEARFSIADPIIEIINAYIEAKQAAHYAFLADCERMKTVSKENPAEVNTFLLSLLRPDVDARIFEIVSFAILKLYYSDQSIFWGWQLDEIEEEPLTLYKTGRTNVNDGGIDFVMRPLGRFFQVTETVDVKKYFLDIDKVQKYPMTFVVKSDLSVDALQEAIRTQAEIQYPVQQVVEQYMSSIEEIINIPILSDYLNQVGEQGTLDAVLDEVIVYSKVEFNLF